MQPSKLPTGCMHASNQPCCMSAYQVFCDNAAVFSCSLSAYNSDIPHVVSQHPQGAICWLAVCRVQQAVHQSLGAACASAFMLLTAMQFHLPFYMSRTLPNTFATAVLGFALADWLTGRHPRRLISLLALATVSLNSLSQYCLCTCEICCL